jgi:hypothetical protein
MAHPAEIARFRLLVIKSFEAGLKKAEGKVKFYERLLKSRDGDDVSVEFAIKQHQHEVTMYKKLLANALGKK